MFGGRRILVVVPARGGSKGMPLKNLREIDGTPMVGLVGEVVRNIAAVDRAVVSTDHEEIAQTATAHGLDAPFRRPEHLSGDRIGDIEVLSHALLETERLDGTQFDVIVMLQPTSPLRTADEVSRTIERLVDEDLDAVWTVSETDSKSHPLKQLVIESGQLGYYDPQGANIIARQQLSTLYHRNGVAYALTRECLLEQKTLMGARASALVLDAYHVSIDTEWDIQLAEFILAQREAPGEGAEKPER